MNRPNNTYLNYHKPTIVFYTLAIEGRGGSEVSSVPSPNGRRFESHSSRNVGTMGKSFIHYCLYNVMWRPVWLPYGEIRLLQLIMHVILLLHQSLTSSYDIKGR